MVFCQLYMFRLNLLSRFGASSQHRQGISENLIKLAELKRTLTLKYADAENLRKTRSADLKKIEDQFLLSFAVDVAPMASKIDKLAVTKVGSATLDATLEGLTMTSSAMRSSLQKYNLTYIMPQAGDVFDARKMSTNSNIPADPNTCKVERVISPGWVYGDRPLIKAVVVVE